MYGRNRKNRYSERYSGLRTLQRNPRFKRMELPRKAWRKAAEGPVGKHQRQGPYPDTYYVDTLSAGTVNTLPEQIHGGRVQGPWRSRPSFGAGPCSGEQCFRRFANQEGLNIDLIMQRLLENGVNSFADSFSDLLAEIAGKRTRLLRGYGHRSASLGKLKKNVDEILHRLDAEKLPKKYGT